MKRKVIVCVFAHPDDEAFGPSGTIYKLARENDVYILCATKGQAGKNSLGAEIKLEEERVQELRKSAKLLGVKHVYFLGFRDGRLCNVSYHRLAKKIEEKFKRLKPNTLLTFEPMGISGHIDHIAVSLATTYVFYKQSFAKSLWYYAITEEKSKVLGKDYFIYFPPGYKRPEMDKIMDVSDIWDVKLKAMYAHKSQKHDADRILISTKNFPKEEYFLVKKK